MTTYYIHRQMNVRNRAYVIDRRGNKIFYGTPIQCQKFIDYMQEGDADNERRDPDRMDRTAETEREPMVSGERR